MMSLEKLFAIASPIRDAPSKLQGLFDASAVKTLETLHQTHNGFYAFENALHVFSDRGTQAEHGLVTWNADDLWRSSYGKLTEGAVFFAEDVFGVQFAIRNKTIVTFDPETGDFTAFADDVDAWAKRLLEDWEVLTGHALAHEWQQQHGPLRPGMRLLPRVPFVLGGAFSSSNLYALEAAKGMRFRASVAMQIRDLPDGAKVQLKVAE